MKKKIKIITISCMIGVCSIGQSVLAKDQMFLALESRQDVDVIIQKKVEEENRRYYKNTKIIQKLNIQKKIEEKNYAEALNREISTRETAVLTRIVEAEATDKDMKSKILVANVILNRVRSKEFPNTIEGVVFQRTQGKVQFSPTADGRYDSVTITKSSTESVRRALRGEDYSEGALYFVEKTIANPRNVSWFESSLHHLFTYQGHSFYK
ncbi:MAG: cell wall hydrolase [Anaerostipes sp.]|nr:cell wall hydrolase [Anaerostipes sp.]